MKKHKWLKYATACIMLIGATTLTSCNMLGPKNSQESGGISFYTGTSSGTSVDGIYKISIDESGHFRSLKKVANTDHPSFLVYSPDRQFLLNVNENQKNDGMGGVESWKIKGDSLKHNSRSVSGGGHPCFIAADGSGFIAVANYTGGNVGLLKLGSRGELSDLLDVAQHDGDSISPRQDSPHAHSAWFEPDGSGVIAADLGTNELWFYTLDLQTNKLTPKPPYKLAMESGAGPRHLAFHPNKKWFYVLNELNSTITRIHKKSGSEYEVEESISTLPDDFTGENLCAHIVVSSDGRFVYASNRGHNSIAIFEVDEETGRLTNLAHEAVRGNWPRHFALSPDEEFLVVANRWSGNLVSFRRDSKTGLLVYVDEAKVVEPVCILF
jgi:6-phosphogluconolactonase